LAEAHNALAIVLARDGNWERSEKSFRHAIELDPNRSMTYRNFAIYLLWPLGRMEEALGQLHVGEKADPLLPDVQYALGYLLSSAGRYDQAAGHCEMLPANYWSKSSCLGRVRWGQRRMNEAIQILEAALKLGLPAGSEIPGYLGYAYARAGRREDAEKLVVGSTPFNDALIFAGLGDKDRTFEALNHAATAGPFRIGRVLTFPEYALLRGDPRLKALRKKVGLPE
jgi:tetratricopeptide (TPR) repeat protein